MHSQARAFSWREWVRNDSHQLSEKKRKREKMINPVPMMISTVEIKNQLSGAE
jgi:hypothetical protein